MDLYYNSNDRAAVGSDTLAGGGFLPIMIGLTREHHEYAIVLSSRA
jgi:hypothetical protein